MAQVATDMDVAAPDSVKDDAITQQAGAEGQQGPKSTPPRARPSSSRPPRDSASRLSPGRPKDPPVEYLFGCSKCRFLKAGCSRCVRKPLAGRPRSRWVPAQALPQEGIPSAPIFRPTAEEFADPYTYIAQIREQASAAGIAMVVPPAGWKPPSMLRDPVSGQLRDDLRFPVRRQPTHLLCRRYATADGGPEEEPKPAVLPAAAAAATVAHDGVGPLPVVPAADAAAGAAGGVAAGAAGADAAAGGSAAAGAMEVDAQGSAAAQEAANASGAPQTGAAEAGAASTAAASGAAADVAMADASAAPADAAAADGPAGASGAAAAAGEAAVPPSGEVPADATASGAANGSPADAAAANGAAAAAGNGADASSSSDDEDAAFGYDHLDRNLSLRQFQRYAAWAKRQHFSEPFCPTATQPPPRLAPKPPASRNGTSRAPGAKAPRRNVIEIPEGGPDWGVVEAEFWRIVEAGDAQVESLYGQDVDTATYGSGFPTSADLATYIAKRDAAAAAAKAEAAAAAAEAAALADSSDDEAAANGSSGKDKKEGKEEQQEEEDELEAALRRFSEDAWNLNNLPHGSGSVLKHVREDIDGKPITGIMVPWLYVGSMFSAFCWHIEDHGLYSINYLHEGAPKIWYGVPAHASKKLEAAMRDALPHLFEADPGLLHRLVTMLSPKQLVARGVPVCRAVHAPGTFVITFPDAYHGGFNSGYNVAEAVNFACPDWLPFGTDSIARYRAQHRPMTFSHDALLVHLVEDGVAGLLAQQEKQRQQEGQGKQEGLEGKQEKEEKSGAAVEAKAEQQEEGQEGAAAVKTEQQREKEQQQKAEAGQEAAVAVKAEQKLEEEQEGQEEQLEEFERPGWEAEYVQRESPSSQQQQQQQQGQQEGSTTAPQQPLEWRPRGGEDAEPLWDLPATADQLAAAAAAAGPASAHHAPSMRALPPPTSMRGAPSSMRTVAVPNAAKAFMPGAAAANATGSGHHHSGHHHGHGHKSQRERKYTMRGGNSGGSSVAVKARPPPPPPSRELTLLAIGELAVRIAVERRLQAVAALEHGVGAVRTMLGERMTLDAATGVHVNTQGVECRVCSADLYMSGVVSSRAPAQAVCPEHAAQLGPGPSERLLLVRHAPGAIGRLLQRAVEVLGREGREVVAVARRRAAAAAAVHEAEMAELEAERKRRADQREKAEAAAEALTEALTEAVAEAEQGERMEGVVAEAAEAAAVASAEAGADATEVVAATASAAAAAGAQAGADVAEVAGAVAAAIRSLGALYDPKQLSRALFAPLEDSSDEDEAELLQPAEDESEDDDERVYVPGVLYSYSSPKATVRTKSGSIGAAGAAGALPEGGMDAAAMVAGEKDAKRKSSHKRKRSVGPKAGVAAHAEAEKARSAADPAAEQAFLEREQEFLASQGIRKRRGAIAAQHHMRALLEYLT